MKALFTNYWLMSAVAGWLAAQILKIVFGIAKYRKLSVFSVLFGCGGMPSSHTAAVAGLCSAVAISEGLDSVSFAITGVLLIIVVVDALGVRRETGMQSKWLNWLMEIIPAEKRIPDPEPTGGKFRELIGHTPLQVAVGGVVGICIAFLMALIPVFGV